MKLYQPLKNILAAFSIFRPDLDYVQGMSYLAASMLLHTGDEFLGFQCFTNLLGKQIMYLFYSFDMAKVTVPRSGAAGRLLRAHEQAPLAR